MLVLEYIIILFISIGLSIEFINLRFYYGILGIVILLLFYILFRYIITIMGIYISVKDIDFNADKIDLSKVDNLKCVYSKELNEIIRKFQYLVDIIDERIEAVNTERNRSEIDKLSGCYNRNMLERLKQTYNQSSSLYIIFFDVNNLKKMNDIYGHEAGDALIKSASNKLKFWSKYGKVYRMGGDEFMVVIQDKKKEAMDNHLNEWYPTVGALNRASDGFKCYISYGVSYSDNLNKNIDLLQKEADDNMYQFKKELKQRLGEQMR